MEQSQLVSEMKGLLRRDDAVKFKLEIFEGGIRREDDWWYVPVASGIPTLSAFDYAPVLNRIEEVFENKGTKVLLVPTLGD